jgi:hypothetical protein
MKFTLEAATVERIFALWNVPLPKSGLVLFAFRGASPVAVAKGWAPSVKLEVTPPDFVHMRCTIGIWDRKSGKIFAAPGSTVPHRDNILKAAARKGVMKGRGTNQLEPGYYTDLTKGEHLQGKPQGHAALRQTGYRFYRRTHHKPPYTNRDPLYFGNPYDNLHCAWNSDPATPGFRSSGCVVVAGWPHSPRLPDAIPGRNKNSGAWKTFHDLIYAAPQKKFPLLLLPAKDVARSLSLDSPEPVEGSKGPGHLVYGSEGEAVKAMQRKLATKGFYKGRITGKLGVGTYRAWMRSHQRGAQS